MSKARILIAEDDAVIALGIRETLERQGYAVPAVVASARDALNETARLKPDVVVLGIGLEGDLSGADVAERILTELQVPVVSLTDRAGETSAGRAGGMTRHGCLVTPLEGRELELTVEMALCQHARERELQERKQWI